MCNDLYYCVLLNITVYYSVLLCIVLYSFVLLCIGLYSFVLLFIESGKLAFYDSVAGRGITNHMGAHEWSNQTYLIL